MTANCVVIADDENLEIAKAMGFETIEMANNPVARKVNAGIELAWLNGADYVAFVGSDDWLHVDLFDPLANGPNGCIVSGREITLVDLSRRVMTRMRSKSLHGVIPWLIPISALEHCSYRPLQEHLNRGLDYSLYRQIRKVPVIFHDPHPHTRVDFKSDTNITPWSMIGRSLGNTPVAPLDELRAWYGDQLVDLAEELA